LVAIEKLFFSKNVKTAMAVAESRGVVRLVGARHGIPSVEFTPTQIKKALSGDGSADKRAVQFMVMKLLRLTEIPRIDDAADALAVAVCASSCLPENNDHKFSK
jgi:crossover junction endodeoxyribonuclease RuvC